ncbi:uncharacterized protein LOC131971150 [Centropristis striata]|uniref:uncharacterized protein LOC131971150 n=1 Tax=Centropristis striata TaxID=184440 RepID=UPI0027DFCA31|nr:uncharacterized protein LOC131971150 [Centropristis striata]
MASAVYSEDLTCPICLTIFTDPVTLLCGHSFCRGCITDVLSSQHQCPQCRTSVATEGTCLPTSYILKNLAEKAKEAVKTKKERGHEKEAAELCPEHDEKLKLFCVTDQLLACIICRDGERHEGHKFKPIKEAAASLRQELQEGVQSCAGDVLATESLANTQREEIRQTKEKSQQLMTQIHRQFEEMHQFLRKREDEIKNELKNKEEDAVEKMNESLKALETALSQSRELEVKLTSVLKIEDSEKFLKSWTEASSLMTSQQLLRPKANDLQVVKTSLSLGPYESHLQFFVWKEMLQVVQPRAELVSLKSNSTDITVSGDGRSVFCTPRSNQDTSGDSYGFTSARGTSPHPAEAPAFASAAGFSKQAASRFGSRGRLVTPLATGFNFGGFGGFSQTMTAPSSIEGLLINTNPEFTSRQHYWEIEVGQRDYWELGIKDNFLKYDGQKYATCDLNFNTELSFEDRPRKIGIYLNCSAKKLSFYNADNMTHIHTMSSIVMAKSLSAYVKIRSAAAADANPLTVCWYYLRCMGLVKSRLAKRETMASALYSEDLTCPICLTIFTDPVTLPCGHSFCRGCITDVLSSQHQCPQCRTAVATEGTCLPTSYILKNLAERAKEAEKTNKERGHEKEIPGLQNKQIKNDATSYEEAAELCTEHDEKLKLFCVTDQLLACIICRDGERHEGHKFKPIKEAAASLRQELQEGVQSCAGDVLATESLANTQREEITKTKEKSQQLMTQIHRQFEEMHQLLRKREDEIKNELKNKEEDAVEKMNESLKALETALSQSRELEVKLTSVLKIEGSEKFLKSWTEANSLMTSQQLLRPKANDLQVVKTSLSLGPYESHLQFFVWKEMLQVVQPRAELVSLKSNSTDITVSGDGRSVFNTPRSKQATSGSLFGSVSGDGRSVFNTPRSNQATSGSLFGSVSGDGRSVFNTPRSNQATSGSLFGSVSGDGRCVFNTPRSNQDTSGSLFGSVSGDGRSVFNTSRSNQATSGSLFGSRPAPTPSQHTLCGFGSAQFGSASFGSGGGFGQTMTPPSSSEGLLINTNPKFTSGQHYWEIEVGHRDYWELGIKDNFLKYGRKKYAIRGPNSTTKVPFEVKPRKIGIYLNCSAKKLSFYNADNMTHIHTMSSIVMPKSLSAYVNISTAAADANPLTVCWY